MHTAVLPQSISHLGISLPPSGEAATEKFACARRSSGHHHCCAFRHAMPTAHMTTAPCVKSHHGRYQLSVQSLGAKTLALIHERLILEAKRELFPHGSRSVQMPQRSVSETWVTSAGSSNSTPA
jgi:hypothetical protein